MGRRHTLVAIVLHWLIAAAVLTNLYLGWRMSRADGMDKFTLFQLHKSVGITVLTLTVLRLAWRLGHSPPPYPLTMTRSERLAAHVVHLFFYLLMLAMPLTGWVVVSASAFNIPTLLYGAIPFPHLGFVHDLPLSERRGIEAGVGTIHFLLAYLFAGLIVLHVAAALKHQFFDRDDVLSRMLPGRDRPIMVAITYIEFDGTEHVVDVADAASVMEGAVDNCIPGIDAECGGARVCATCQVYVDAAWLDRIGPASEMEADMLEFSDHAKANSRLSCQIKVSDALDGLIVRLPESQR